MLENTDSTNNAAAADSSVAAADSTTTTASDAPLTQTDIVEKLAAAYETRARNEGTTEGDQATADEDSAEAETETEIDQPDAPEDAPGDTNAKAEAEDTSEAEEDSGEEKSDFDALTKRDEQTAPEFPDIDALKTKYPRQSKAFYEEAAKLSENAKKGYDAVQAIGGEDFVLPLAKISKGLQAGDNQSFFEGVMDAASTDGLLKVTGDSLVLSLISANEWVKNEGSAPELAEVGRAMLANADKVIAARFGEDVTIEQLDRLATLAKLGWIEKLDQWREQEFVDSDEWYEMLETTKAPEQFLSLKAQAKQTTQQLAEANSKLAARDTQTDAETDQKFISDATSKIETVLTDVVWKRSVLRELPQDSAELKEEKQALRDRLKTDAITAFQSNIALKDLLASARSNEKNNPTFQAQLTTAIDEAILDTREQTAVFERIAAKLIGNTRNASIGQAKPLAKAAANTGNSLQPTQTHEPETNKPKTQEQIMEDHKQRLIELSA